jgi:hypothetical protein
LAIPFISFPLCSTEITSFILFCSVLDNSLKALYYVSHPKLSLYRTVPLRSWKKKYIALAKVNDYFKEAQQVKK